MTDLNRTLQTHLQTWAGDDPRNHQVAETIQAIADAAVELSELIHQGPLMGELGATVGANQHGDEQKALDVQAHEAFLCALRDAPVAVVGSEEADQPLVMNKQAPLAVNLDPLDGSSNIDVNVSIGTIFSVLPVVPSGIDADPATHLLQRGANQLAAGFVIYGPQTVLALTVGRGVDFFVLHRYSSTFLLSRRNVQIPSGQREFAINASNYRHWDRPVRAYIDDCINRNKRYGGSSFNMRWIASLVAETYRILIRGGVFLYPRDERAGYQSGRLRHVYEANPMAFLIEQAGGAATDGEQRILDIDPTDLHGRVPLVFGSIDHVERVASYHSDLSYVGEARPLFGYRGLFQS